MLNFGASKPRVEGGARAPGPPPDPHLTSDAMLSDVITYIANQDSPYRANASDRCFHKSPRLLCVCNISNEIKALKSNEDGKAPIGIKISSSDI